MRVKGGESKDIQIWELINEEKRKRKRVNGEIGIKE